MDTLRKVVKKLPSGSGRPYYASYSSSCFNVEEPTPEVLIKKRCQQTKTALTYLRKVWYSKTLAGDVFFNSYNNVLDQVEELNIDVQKKVSDTQPSIDLATTELHKKLSHLIKYCDSVTMDFDDNPSWTDDGFEAAIVAVDLSIQNFLDAIKELFNSATNMTQDAKLQSDAVSITEITQASEATLSVKDSLTDAESIDSFMLDNFEEISAEQQPEIIKVVDRPESDTEDNTEQKDEIDDLPTMRMHDRSISEESRRSRISNRLSAPSQIQTYIKKLCDAKTNNEDNRLSVDSGFDFSLLAPTTEEKVPDKVQVASNTIITEIDESKYLIWEQKNDERKIIGGPIDALIVAAANSKDNYGEAFITTFRTFLEPKILIEKLIYRYQNLTQNNSSVNHKRQADQTFFLLIRVVNDLTLLDLTQTLLQDLLNLSHELIADCKIKWAKILRKCIFDKVSIFKAAAQSPVLLTVYQPLTSQRDDLLYFKSDDLAQQMTLLDMELFQKIEIAEMFNFAKNQQDDQSPNLAIFGQHFDKMSKWVRTQIFIQTKDKNREKYMKKFIMIMESLMDYSNFNSYLSLLAALNAPEISRMPSLKKIEDKLAKLGKVFESARNHALYRQKLLSAEPPCIPYIGLILQDLTLCHVGNSDLLDDKCSINFNKRWFQYNIVVNMKRFKNDKYQIERNDRIVAFLNNFDDHMSEELLHCKRTKNQ